LRVPNGEEALPNRAGESWRTWLITGARRGPVDRRRVRGAHVGIKRMLVEGVNIPTERPYTWKEFSDAMVRQAVGDAMQTLSYRDAQVVKLAYFGGLTNREIADHMSITEATVERRLRSALEAISRFVERGHSFGRRILVGVALWLSARTASDLIHSAAQGLAVATAAAIIATHPTTFAVQGAHGSPAPATHATMPVVPPVPSPTAPVTGSTDGTTSIAPADGIVPAPAVTVPSVQVPSVQVPPLPAPSLPPLIKNL
jgi:RNA polymerase sigma factor (sigma-70 family)